jgi:hypothetical protein
VASQLGGCLNWQRDTKDCSAPARNATALISNHAAMTMNDLSCDPEPEPISFRFVTLEGFEEGLSQPIRYPFSVISDRYDSIWVTHSDADVEIPGMR